MSREEEGNQRDPDGNWEELMVKQVASQVKIFDRCIPAINIDLENGIYFEIVFEDKKYWVVEQYDHNKIEVTEYRWFRALKEADIRGATAAVGTWEEFMMLYDEKRLLI